MAEPKLKVIPDSAAPAEAKPQAKPKRGKLRMILLLVVPVVAALGGTGVYLAGGGSISTDNAYVGAQKVLITPDISGKVARVDVREGEHVKAGDPLFEIDRQPFELAAAQAQAKLAAVRTDFANLKSNLASLNKLAELAVKNVDIKQRDVERKTSLVASRAGSQTDLDNANAAVVAAQLQAQYAEQQKATTLNQLLGDSDLPIERFPAFQQANAALEQAQRDLDHTTMRAPIAGTATQVDNVQLGRFVAAGTPVLSVVDDTAPWVDANPKETDITHLRIGQPATVEIDSFPDHTFHGHVVAVSPGTGSQFSILPAQNASGNWVKVVQRVPLRIELDKGEPVERLRAGMSATVDIETGHARSLGDLFGQAKAAQ